MQVLLHMSQAGGLLQTGTFPHPETAAHRWLSGTGFDQFATAHCALGRRGPACWPWPSFLHETPAHADLRERCVHVIPVPSDGPCKLWQFNSSKADVQAEAPPVSKATHLHSRSNHLHSRSDARLGLMPCRWACMATVVASYSAIA
eukprot:1153554-Pelagomonas_calceolata.AAC.2